jgi:alcohol dehydrogenase class IV
MFSVDSVWDLRVVRAKFGTEAIEEIGYDAKTFGGTRALIVTDKGVAKAGLLEMVKRPLERQEVKTEIWDEVEPEPSYDSLLKVIEFASNRNIDFFVGVGGGSSIDTAKIVNLVTTHKGEILDYAAAPIGKGKKIERPCRPLVAVPTTAGTGSETSPAAIFSLPGQPLKYGIASDFMKPSLAILDPLMTLTVPSHVTASTGMDALSHAVESYVTWSYDTKLRSQIPTERPTYGGTTQLTDMFATKSIELINNNLRIVVHRGNDVKARSDMLLASFLAGVAFTNAGLGAVHAASYPVGSRYHAPHGVVCAILLPAVMKYNMPSNYHKYAEIAKLLGEDTVGVTVREGAHLALDALRTLMRDIGMPFGLSDLGAKEQDVPELAKDAMKVQRLLAGNPRPVTERDMQSILTDALKNE